MIKVGTDCSGIEAPIQALKQLKIPFKHIFSSDIDKYCIQSIKANYNPKILFGDSDSKHPQGDITKRNIKNVPDIDLYIAGFPCQPFSHAGSRKGFKDKRSNVFYACLEVIKEKQPNYFILENVKGLTTHDNKRTLATVLNELEDVDIYDIYYKILNTKDYGIPQNRERIFIIGIKKSLIQSFKWPKKKKLKNIQNFVDYDYIDEKANITTRIKKYIKTLPEDSCFVDLSFSGTTNYPNSDQYSPCLLTSGLLWCVPMDRKANIKEYLKLQGFPANFKQVVSDRQMKKQIGNSMSVNVIKEILNVLLN